MTEPALAPSPLVRRLRLAAILMTLGLLIEVATLRSVHPFAFLTFAFLGMTLVGAAVLLYLYAIVSDR
jgi:hypothetical protein